MDFGVFLAPYHPVGESPLMTFRRDLELIAWCDRLGFDELWREGDATVGLAIPGRETGLMVDAQAMPLATSSWWARKPTR